MARAARRNVGDKVASLGESSLLRRSAPNASGVEDELPPAGPPGRRLAPAPELPDIPAPVSAPSDEPGDQSPTGASHLADIDDLLRDDATAPEPERATAPARRPARRRASDPEANTNVSLPVSVKERMKNHTRPHRTGADRVLGAHFLARAYIMAVEELIGESVDLHGLGSDSAEEAVRRVRAALESHYVVP